MNLYKILFILIAPLFCLSCKKDQTTSNDFTVTVYDPVPVAKTNPVKLYMHYMPWFETPETNNGKWGWHWTMNNKNPDRIVDGKREIASWYYPLIGPYASSDPSVLEYHLLLMKYAGIDGVLVDWYGTQQTNDLPGIAKNTDALFKAIEKTGLEFAIVYEDRFLSGSKTAMINQAKTDMLYLQSNYFNKNYYTKINGKPLLLVFGPITLQSSSDWEDVFSVFSAQPTFLTLQDFFHTANTRASGEYMWVDNRKPEDKYATATATGFPVFFGAAYPGFRDFYKEGGDGDNLNVHWDYDNGNLFKSLLDLGKNKNMKYLQLETWNDFGEGTMIEPTLEFAYTFLTINQQFAEVKYGEKELKSIKLLYDLRKANEGKREINKKLDQVFYYFVSLQYDKADELLSTLE
jgi:hypothetical protein